MANRQKIDDIIVRKYCFVTFGLVVFLFALFLSGTAVRAQDNRTITINIHEELGEDTAAVKEILQLHPDVRIGEPADFEIARFPDFPQDLILIDRSYTRKNVDLLKVYGNILDHAGYVGHLPVMPKNVGRLFADEPSFGPEILKQLRRIARAKEWQALAKANSQQPSISTEVTFLPPSANDSTKFGNFLAEYHKAEITVRNEGAKSRYVYVVQIDPDHHIVTLSPINGKNSKPLRPGKSRKYGGKNLRQYFMAQYYHVTVSSDSPIDTQIFDPASNARISPGDDWTITLTAAEKPPFSARLGGGGFQTPYAPWQIQLYSTALTKPGSNPGAIKADDTVKIVTWENYLDVHRCGGSLIAPDIVLTAAHCVAKKPFIDGKEQHVLKDRRVRLGTRDLKKYGTTYAIDSIVVHAAYRPGSVYNDIAIIRIKPDRSTRPDRIVEEDKPKPILLPDKIVGIAPPKDGEPVSWFGWGVTGETALRDTSQTVVDGELVKQEFPEFLREGEMALLANDKCRLRTGYSKVTDFMLCAVTPQGPRDPELGNYSFTCLGDSGGPIIRKASDKERYVQIGVISWAVGCGVNDNPSVSANLFRYVRWVRAAIPHFETGKRVSFKEN